MKLAASDKPDLEVAHFCHILVSGWFSAGRTHMRAWLRGHLRRLPHCPAHGENWVQITPSGSSPEEPSLPPPVSGGFTPDEPWCSLAGTCHSRPYLCLHMAFPLCMCISSSKDTSHWI